MKFKPAPPPSHFQPEPRSSGLKKGILIFLIFAGIILLILAVLYFSGILIIALFSIACLILSAIILAILIVAALLLVLIPYYLVTKKPKVEYGSYTLEEVKGKEDMQREKL